MRLNTIALLSFLIIGVTIVQAEKQQFNNIYYEFSQFDNTYAFRGGFFTQADQDCLIKILYDYEHLVKFVTSADSIELIRRDVNWYEVSYTYRGLLYKNKYTYRKVLDQEKQEVGFEMIASEQHGLFLPKVISSTGYYKIRQDKSGYSVEYFQENRMESNLFKGIYIQMAKKEAEKYLKELEEYVERTCH